jgi:cytochrome c biogenesis factor
MDTNCFFLKSRSIRLDIKGEQRQSAGGQIMKKAVKLKAGILVVAAVIGLLIFTAFYHDFYVKHDISRNSHPVLGLLVACSALWLTAMIWLSIATLLVLLITSPFLIWPSLRPIAIRSWTIGVMGLLCARFILFYVGLPVNPNRSMEPSPAAHFQVHFQPHLYGQHHRPGTVHSS